MKTKFEIVDCCGDHIEFVELVVPADVDACNLIAEYEEEILTRWCGDDRYEDCECCGGQVYSVRLV